MRKTRITNSNVTKTASLWLGLIVLLFVALSSTFYLCEAYLRINFRPSHLLGGYYPLGPNIAGARLRITQREYDTVLNYNQSGFRDKDFTIVPENHTRRILFLGDSFIEGLGVDEEHRASNIVNRLLLDSDVNAEVLNAGQLATNPPSYFDNLTRFGLALKPDVIVVGIFVGNDFMWGREYGVPKGYQVTESGSLNLSESQETPIIDFMKFGYSRNFVGGALKKRPVLVKPARSDKFWDHYYKEPVNRDFFRKHSGLSKELFEQKVSAFNASLLDDFFNGRLNPSYLLSSITPSPTGEKRRYNDDDVRNVFLLIREMHRLSLQHNARFLVVVYPDAYQVMPEQYAAHLRDHLQIPKIPETLSQLGGVRHQFRKKLDAAQIEYLDLTNRLGPKDFHLFDGHLNRSGQRIAGEAIYARLQKWKE